MLKWKPVPGDVLQPGKICSWKGYLFTEEDKIYAESVFSFAKHPLSFALTAGILCHRAVAGLSRGSIPINHFSSWRRQLCSLQIQHWDVSKKRGREKQYKQPLTDYVQLHVKIKTALGQPSWGLHSPLSQTAPVHPTFKFPVGQQLSKDARGHSNCDMCQGQEACASCPSANTSHSYIVPLPRASAPCRGQCSHLG